MINAKNALTIAKSNQSYEAIMFAVEQAILLRIRDGETHMSFEHVGLYCNTTQNYVVSTLEIEGYTVYHSSSRNNLDIYWDGAEKKS